MDRNMHLVALVIPRCVHPCGRAEDLYMVTHLSFISLYKKEVILMTPLMIFHWVRAVVCACEQPEVMRRRCGDRLPVFTEEDKALLKGSSDFFGFNHCEHSVTHSVEDPLMRVLFAMKYCYINRYAESRL